MKKIKSIIASLLAIVMLMTVAPISASAKAMNTPQTAIPVGIGTTPVLFRQGYPGGKGTPYVTENEINYVFVPEITDYYELSATGYETTVYAVGYTPNVSVNVKNSAGQSQGTAYTNSTTLETKKAFPLTAGEVYYINVYSSFTNIDSFKNPTNYGMPQNYGYAEQVINLNIARHEHVFDIKTYYYDYGTSVTYDCFYCDYSVRTFTDNRNGEVSTTVKSSIGDAYYVQSAAPIKINIKKLTAGKKCFTVKWAKPQYASGYQIQYATDSKFKKNKKTVTVSSSSSVSKKISGLKAKKKYYVRIRTYTTTSGNKSYSKWSSVKSVKTK